MFLLQGVEFFLFKWVFLSMFENTIIFFNCGGYQHINHMTVHILGKKVNLILLQ